MRRFMILMGIAAVIMVVLPALVGCASPDDGDIENLLTVKQVQNPGA